MLSIAARRWYVHRRHALPAVLARVWSAPLPRRAVPVEDLRFLVCDAEMTGLDPRSCTVLSLGWVAVEGGEIDLGTARHVLLEAEQGVGPSAAVHGLRDCELRDGMAPREALATLLADAQQRIFVFHNAALDLAFLDRMAAKTWGVPLLLPAVDTMKIEERILHRERGGIRDGDLRLRACRSRYGLGRHREHSALGDAIATAELFLAQLAVRGPGLKLRDLR